MIWILQERAQIRKSYNIFLNKTQTWVNNKLKIKEELFETAKAMLLKQQRQKQRMSKQKEVQKFKQKLSNFIKPHKCQHHSKNLNIVCIDSNCQNQGLICSICLTINGAHKNHDAVDVNEYIQNCFKELNKQKSGDQALDLLARAQAVYDNLLTVLSAFVQNCAQIVKTYISLRSQLHDCRAKEINSRSFINKIMESKFQSLPQVNKVLKSLASKYTIHEMNKSGVLQSKILNRAQEYVEDISYQIEFIGKELRKMQVRLKSILVVKQANPIILNYEPSFHQPTLLQNNDLIYIGQSKDQKPHGKGICFHLNGQKVIFGQFLNGKVDGMAELYYPTGDYYLGQFKNDKKNGRGVYRWNGKEYNIYQGEFKAGRRHGRGTFWWSDGSKYVGQFFEGHQQGHGVLYRTLKQKQYQGHWQKGQFDGKGIQYFPNGERYQGEFRKDKFHGSGILYKQKQTIHGKWVENQLVSIQKSEE